MTLPSLLPVESEPGAWGVEELREGHPTRVLCECGHASPEEALACARPRSLERLGELAYTTMWEGRPSVPWDRLYPCGRELWRGVAAAVLQAVRP